MTFSVHLINFSGPIAKPWIWGFKILQHLDWFLWYPGTHVSALTVRESFLRQWRQVSIFARHFLQKYVFSNYHHVIDGTAYVLMCINRNSVTLRTLVVIQLKFVFTFT